jgi:hypothetical protein
MAQEMERVNNSRCITFDYKHKPPTTVPWMFYFQGFYLELRDLLRIKHNAVKGVSKTLESPILQPRSPGIESTTSNSTDATGVSSESNKEHHTQGCARAFLLATLQTLDEPLKAQAWFSDQYDFSSKYVPLKPC